MHLIRNPEVKRLLAVYIVFTVAAAGLAALLFEPAVALYIFMICSGVLVLFLFNIRKRYHAISDLCLEIDKILHANERIYMVPNQEGELAILTSQLSKLTMRLQEQAELLEKEKDNLSNAIADISHQIRTPLTSIRMTMHRLMKEDISFEQRNECICEMGSSLTRIEWLTTALLKIAGLESGTVEMEQKKVPVCQLVEKALKPLEVMMELKTIRADVNIPQNTGFMGDMGWTIEALSNIVKNCIEHTAEGGCLTIRAEENSLYTRLVISDNGCGIATEDLPHLFERFYKGRNSSAQNIGIGLSLSRMIIKIQNGTIKVRNLSPGGTEFEIFFYKRM